MDPLNILINIVLLLLGLVIFWRSLQLADSKSMIRLEEQLRSFKEEQNRLQNYLQEENSQLRRELLENQTMARQESSYSLKGLSDSLLQRLSENLNGQQKLLDGVSKQLKESSSSLEKRVVELTTRVDTSLETIRRDNTEKLEKMRHTVEEKLDRTLKERLGQSFKMVSENLEEVQRGLGEMQSLAVGVGDLKKVLSQVKTRGILGEIQLRSILDEILSPEQYDTKVVINPDSGEQVDFALRLPGSDKNSVVWLPMDAKFPMEPYQNVLDAINNGDQDSINLLQKELINTLKRYAKELNTKFINPPHTTEFALLFIPVEGMYADIVRAPGVIETLQRDYSITIAGPTTFAALLNSLQMGFRTIAIQRRSTEVWHLLGAVKTEFNHFEKVLTKAQKRLHLASDEIELLVGQKTRQIQKRLLQVESLPNNETSTLLDIEDELLEEDFEQLEENMANEIQETL